MSSAAAAPHVGISAYGEPARWGPWDRPAALVPMSYPEAVAAAGGVPVLLPPLPGIEAAVSRLDALVLSGGGDIDPAAYGADPAPAHRARVSRPGPGRAGPAGRGPGRRDTGPGHLPRPADRQRVPRRHAAPAPARRGGPPSATVPRPGRTARTRCGSRRTARSAGSSGRPGRTGRCARTCPPHTIRPSAGSAQGLVATAWADDGTIEAVQPDPARNGAAGFLLAVQWHPEAGDDLRLFEALVAKAGTGKAGAAQPLDSRA